MCVLDPGLTFLQDPLSLGKRALSQVDVCVTGCPAPSRELSSTQASTAQVPGATVPSPPPGCDYPHCLQMLPVPLGGEGSHLAESHYTRSSCLRGRPISSALPACHEGFARGTGKLDLRISSCSAPHKEMEGHYVVLGRSRRRSRGSTGKLSEE